MTAAKIRQAVFDSHKAALLSGLRYSPLRFWKSPGDGLMTPEECKQRYSRHYPLLGLFTWAELQLTTLPNWALPHGHEDFSVENHPRVHDLKL
jgi:hypothetical protein